MTETKTTYEPVIVPQIQKAAGTLLDVTKLWATQGLSVGKQVLETSAKSLTLTAEMIEGLRQRVDAPSKR
ncbi:MAG: hypothetical protein R3B40_01460 [Polyangiales bacterium]|nr:hypothetical protein [Sandaracinaceae bacterium]